MSNSLAVINCAQLVTLAGAARPRRGAEMRELGIIHDGALLIRDGLIECTGQFLLYFTPRSNRSTPQGLLG